MRVLHIRVFTNINETVLSSINESVNFIGRLIAMLLRRIFSLFIALTIAGIICFDRFVCHGLTLVSLHDCLPDSLNIFSMCLFHLFLIPVVLILCEFGDCFEC